MLYLPEKRTELDTSFVIDESLGEETTTVTSLENACAQVDVLAVAHGSKAAQSIIDASLDAKVEATRIELVHFFLAATDATRGEKRGHRIIDGLLYGRERRMGAVGTAEGVARLAVELFLDDFQIVFWHDDIGIQYNKVLALAALGAIVA